MGGVWDGFGEACLGILGVMGQLGWCIGGIVSGMASEHMGLAAVELM